MVSIRFKAAIKTLYTNISYAIKNRIYEPDKDALFVFGFQKSGTTAIAGLLSQRTDKPATLDTKFLWPPYLKLLKSGQLTIEQIVNTYSYPFSKPIIKEPNLTFFINELSELFYLNRYIFIVRNPFDNIRSVLNRLQLPGNQDYIDIKRVHPNWRHFFKSDGENYIKDIADVWCELNSQKNIIGSSKCILIRYEDFLNDKNVFISQLAKDVGFECKNDISQSLDYQFQPKGRNYCDLRTFYGKKNYRIIESTCSELMNYFGY